MIQDNITHEPPKKRIKISASQDAAVSHSIETESVSSSQQERKKFRSDGKRHVQKGSLVLEELVKEKEEARNQHFDKKVERRAANRLSAFQSRQRKKLIIDELRETVSQLTKESESQRGTITNLEKKIEAASRENELLRVRFMAAASVPKPHPPAPQSIVVAQPVQQQQQQPVSIQSLVDLIQQHQQQKPQPPQPTFQLSDLATLFRCIQQA